MSLIAISEQGDVRAWNASELGPVAESAAGSFEEEEDPKGFRTSVFLESDDAKPGLAADNQVYDEQLEKKQELEAQLQRFEQQINAQEKAPVIANTQTQVRYLPHLHFHSLSPI